MVPRASHLCWNPILAVPPCSSTQFFAVWGECDEENTKRVAMEWPCEYVAAFRVPNSYRLVLCGNNAIWRECNTHDIHSLPSEGRRNRRPCYGVPHARREP